jgi:hypothetical protein
MMKIAANIVAQSHDFILLLLLDWKRFRAVSPLADRRARGMPRQRPADHTPAKRFAAIRTAILARAV